MSDYKKVIAVCGVWLYEEKEYGFISEFNRYCKDSDYIVMAFNFSIDTMDVDDDIMREKKLLELMGHLDCAAVVIMGETIKSERMYDLVKKAIRHLNVPTFSLEYYIEGCINISMRFGDGFKQIIEHVIKDHGCRKINMIAGMKENPFSVERVEAYKEALAEAGIPFEEKRLEYGNFWEQPAKLATNKFLDSGDIPDAIVCANDAMAVAACEVLKERGYNIPEDIIVTGFDGLDSAQICYPSISTVAPDYTQEVELIFDFLKKIENGEDIKTDETIYIDFKIVKNQSCGCGKPDEREVDERIKTLSVLSNDQKWHMMAVNRLILNTNDLFSLSEMPPHINECVGLWVKNFFFISIYEQFFDQAYDDDTAAGKRYIEDDSCITMLRIEDYETIPDPIPFKEKTLIPNMKEVLRKDKGYDMFMVRLINNKNDVYGYIIEGFRDSDARSMRRCEEFGLFLSTAITSVLKNRKLMMLNDKLKRINKEMEQASVRDYLTELYNRRGFYDELYKMVRSIENRGRYLTFFSIDMDGLKIINDTYGHNEGDFALKTLANAIKHFAARNGICARYGGDEFVCAIVTDTETKLTPEIVRDRFSQIFSKNTELKEKPYEVCASIGCRCTLINDDLDLGSLMREADKDMYQDKISRRKSRM